MERQMSKNYYKGKRSVAIDRGHALTWKPNN
jgi:hypothetical protein